MNALTSLRVRLPLLGMFVLAMSLGLTTLLSYQLLSNVGQDELDVLLRTEQRRFEQSVAAASDAAASAATPIPAHEIVFRAAEDYLRLQPAGEDHLEVIRIGSEIFARPTGPPELIALVDNGELGPRSPGRLETVETSIGRVRSLVAPVTAEGTVVATFQVAAVERSLSVATAESLRRMTFLAVTSLVVGGALLALALYRGLAPLRDLAATARQTQFADLSSRVPVPERMDEVGVLAREFNHMLERLDGAARDRREFMASISHELRTPITIARGHIETLEHVAARNPAAVAETAAVVRDELHRLSRLVEDLMALARSEMDDFVVPAPVRLDRFFDDLELRLTGLGTSSVTLRPPEPITFVADADRIAQALLNLIVNATVHTPAGTPIEVSARREGHALVFSVHDEGPGIPPEVRDRVFEPFVKAPTQGVHPSTGLGLAVVAAVVRAHRGRVAFDSGARGTTVLLTFPIDGVTGMTGVNGLTGVPPRPPSAPGGRPTGHDGAADETTEIPIQALPRMPAARSPTGRPQT